MNAYVKPPNAQQSWSGEDASLARMMWSRGTSPAEIANYLGRTEKAVKTKLRELGAAVKWNNPEAETRRWTTAEDDMLMSLKWCGMDTSRIAKRLNRSVVSVRKRYTEIHHAYQKPGPVHDKEPLVLSNRRACALHLIDLMRAYEAKTVGAGKAIYRQQCELDIGPEFEGRPTALPSVSAFDTMSVIGSQF